MANDQTSDKDFATTAAKAVGRTLGSIVGTVDRLRAEHPHPITEAQEVIAQGQAKVDAMAELLTTLVQYHQSMHGNMDQMMSKMKGAAAK